MMTRRSVPALCLLLCVLASCDQGSTSSSSATTQSGAGTQPGGGGGGGGTRPVVAVIPKGTTHQHWKSVHEGARRAGEEFGIDVVWKGPLREDDRAQQIAVVQQFVTDRVAGIVVAPLDDKALLRPVQAAAAAKIPVVIFDSALAGQSGRDFISYVATDNKRGGHLGGEQLAKLLGGRGKVVLLRYQLGSASTDEREAGFREAIAKSPEIRLISDNRFAGATVDTAKSETLNMLDVLKDADGIFCPNESSTMGMLLTLRQNGLAGKVKFVGFDASAELVSALEKGEVHGLVAQDPLNMGYLAVKAVADQLAGRPVQAVVDTGVHLVTPESIGSPEIKKLLRRE